MDQSFQGWGFFFLRNNKGTRKNKKQAQHKITGRTHTQGEATQGAAAQGERCSPGATNCVCAPSDPPTLGFTWAPGVRGTGSNSEVVPLPQPGAGGDRAGQAVPRARPRAAAPSPPDTLPLRGLWAWCLRGRGGVLRSRVGRLWKESPH